ncbi:outer membrane protein assembly factor BamA [Cerasicoccus arenae]|uniref:Outer membrane protein assembly factor BamA n=1 Tax=Cerasicoccus arenae TaxID=424488 RepID=A0A8J3GF37_9BACT|nr:outer membrane protein assembly factor BamA [Cerasicoccus arenae]MBK1859841.1 outer membrane protein assembly factor BamA [Cerasicoccus arenae]GHC08329.1 outer membrane protein assembly factor BamA [Cerasicoccus arenae]
MKTTRHNLLDWTVKASLLLFLILQCPLARGQDASANAPIVEKVDIQFEGFKNVSEQNVLAHIQQRVGLPYQEPQVDKSVRSLYQSGLFEFIEARRTTLPNGNFELTFVVVPKYRITGITFEGLVDSDADDLEDEIETSSGLPLDEVQVKRDSTKIFDLLQKDGYTNAKVSYRIDRNDTTGTAVVIFVVDEGERLDIDNIEFVGNENFSSSTLRDMMTTTEYFWLWSWLVGGGRLQEEDFQRDLDIIRDYYKNEGYLDVEIPESEVVLEYPASGELDIIITIHEGRRYYVGNITFEGNKLFTTERLVSILATQTDDVFSPKKIDEDVELLKDFYGQIGYLDTFIRIERLPNVDTGKIDLTFVVTEGEQFYVESITLQGNTKTRSSVIIRELALAPGDVFDLVRMKASQARLENTRFFEAVNLAPEASNLPNRRNLRVTVKEGSTGNLTFGAGFSSIESVVAFAELTQSNFDIFNYRSMFQGGGQKFRLRFSIGVQSSEFLLSFEEPWVFQRELAFGFEIYRTESDYLSSSYNELRTGMELYLRKRLFELVEGRLSYTIEQVDIKDVDPYASPVIQQEKGIRTVSKLGFQLLRDTRNNLLWTTSGNRLEYITELAGTGIGGNTDYIRQEVRATQYIPTFDLFDQTIRLHARTGTVIPTKTETGVFFNQRAWLPETYEDGVPFFDKYFLGGPYTLRGFNFREVGPKDPISGEALGGDTMGLVQVEYIFRFMEQLGMKFFYDGGFVNQSAGNWIPTSDTGTGVLAAVRPRQIIPVNRTSITSTSGGWNDDVGVGLIILLLGSPLNLDFAWPIHSDQFNESSGPVFNFSFGTVF